MRSGKYYPAVKINGVKHDVHRLVAEKTLGRPLLPGEVVHHINGDKQDNRPENLRVEQRRDHSRHHAHERPVSGATREKLRQANLGRRRYDLRALTPEQAREAARLHKSGMSWRAIGRRYGAFHQTVIKNVQKYEQEATQ